MHDHIDHVTGIEKREFLAHMAGNCDPWRILAIKKGTTLYTARSGPSLRGDARPHRPRHRDREERVPGAHGRQLRPVAHPGDQERYNTLYGA
ncbi:Cytochrome c oxidase, subunit VB [Operophtera brumata]|uniref:Cytochrome c oxidase, subunit VB n=1 Tax=Operophtera brumata TaxID=104452 RepID=A0A0L7KRK8_OPEBR|nr:Cytochrome c oxidase, subunit VB [Operophtera brumata]